MKLLAILLLLAGPVWADSNIDARTLLDRVAANRATKDFSLKARLFLTRDGSVNVELLVKNDPAETRTIYRSGTNAVLIVQPARGEPRYYLRGARPSDRFLGSQFTYYDLGVPFLQWPDPKYVGDDRVRGRDCHVLEVQAAGQPYVRVKLWIDREYTALLRAEAYDQNDAAVKRWSITSFKRLGELWIPRALECASRPAGQSLPSAEKSRLEIYDGNYDAKLPATDFAEENFGPLAR